MRVFYRDLASKAGIGDYHIEEADTRRVPDSTFADAEGPGEVAPELRIPLVRRQE